jgi:hypothetical protein
VLYLIEEEIAQFAVRTKNSRFLLVGATSRAQYNYSMLLYRHQVYKTSKNIVMITLIVD